MKDNVATRQPVNVQGRSFAETVIQSAPNGGEVVVTDGHLLLTDGTPSPLRERKAGA